MPIEKLLISEIHGMTALKRNMEHKMKLKFNLFQQDFDNFSGKPRLKYWVKTTVITIFQWAIVLYLY